jgi:hypothetical protein
MWLVWGPKGVCMAGTSHNLQHCTYLPVLFFQRGLIFMTGRIHYYSILSQYCLEI